MDRTPTFDGLDCIDCGTRSAPREAAGRCPHCDGILDPAYAYEEIELSRADFSMHSTGSMWGYEDLLPFPRRSAVTLDEGATPLLEAPRLADALGVGRLLIKDEGRNPTGTFKDRGHSLAVTAAADHGATDIALASAGNAGHSAAAYASRAGIDAHVFLPSRAGFGQKAMVSVHGGDLTVVEGRIGDAVAAYEDALREQPEWHSTQTFVTPYRHEGKKTMLYEIVEASGWSVPDAIVYPTGGGVGLVGLYKGADELATLGLVGDRPALYAAQSTGCAPIVEAWQTGADRHTPWAAPETVCGGIEIPDPGASPWILAAIRDTGGGAVATDDAAILEAAVTVARLEGLEVGATAAAAVSGASDLAAAGEFGPEDTVVVVNTGAGFKDADVLRSHLAGR